MYEGFVRMNGISKKRREGLTLIELMVTVLLIAIAVIGAMVMS